MSLRLLRSSSVLYSHFYSLTLLTSVADSLPRAVSILLRRSDDDERILGIESVREVLNQRASQVNEPKRLPFPDKERPSS